MKTVDILKQLIAIPSYVDGAQNEQQLADFIVQFFQQNVPRYKIQKQVVEGVRYNIIASILKSPTYAFVDHMDTVLPKQQTSQPFVPVEENGTINGLGSVDTKSGVATMLNIAATSPRNDLMFIFTVDEEYEFKGMKALCASNILKQFGKPKLILNLEPTDLKILNGCRGITEFSFVVRGKAAHSGRKNLGVNAIEQAVELTKKLEQAIHTLDPKNGEKSTLNLAYLRGGMLKSCDENTIVLSDLGLVVPDYAEVNCEIRFANAKTTEEKVQSLIEQFAIKANVQIEKLKFKFLLNSFVTDKRELKELEQAIQSCGISVEYQDVSRSGFYEVQMLQQAWNVPAVAFGVGPSDTSHSAHEYVSIESLTKAEMVVTMLLKDRPGTI